MPNRKLLYATSFVVVLTTALSATALRQIEAKIEKIPSGAEWIAGQRTFLATDIVGPAPASFLRRHHKTTGWTQRTNGPTGDFRRIWGEGIPVDARAMTDPAVALAVANRFWEENADLLPGGVRPMDLEPWSNTVWQGIRFVSHRQIHGGLPVLGTGNFIAIARGRIVLLGVRSFPVQESLVPYSATPALAASEAQQISIEALAELGVLAAPQAPSLQVVPMIKSDRVWFEQVYSVDLSAPGLGHWTVHVNAVRGGVVAIKDNRRFIDGSLSLQHHDRNPPGGFIESPGSFLRLALDNGTLTTDIDGEFARDEGSERLTTTLNGTFVRVIDPTGPEIEFNETLDGGLPGEVDYVWQVDGGEKEQAQLDAYRFASEVREHALEITNGVPWLNQQLQVTVNNSIDMTGDGVADYCNAWFDGQTINFLPAGKMGSYECNNTAMIADIVYHEFGHGLHMYSMVSGVAEFDGAVSEGFADTLATSITQDPTIGPYFTTNGGYVRELETDLVWPRDQSPQDPHYTGLILGGAIWDLRKAFKAELGDEAGNAITDHLFAGAMKTTVDIPSSYEGVLLVDDDNGNLADGTEHFCTIYDAFDLHGLASDAIGRITIDHQPVALEQPANQAIAISATVAVGNKDCNVMGSFSLSYSTDAGNTWNTAPMTEGEDSVHQSQIPGQPEGTEILYRLEALEQQSGDVIRRPNNPAEPYYRIYTGTLEEILCDDFEGGDDGDWTHELLDGEWREGADDWQRKNPTGKAGDPTSAYSGDNVWGNDLVPENQWDGRYQEDKVNTLRGPTWDLSDYETVRLRLRRWLTVEDGNSDQASIYVNEKRVWVNAAGESGNPTDHIDREWIHFDLDISDTAAKQSEVQVRFEIASDYWNQFGGWNIDDVCLYGKKVESEPDAGTGPDGDADTDSDTNTDTDPDTDTAVIEDGGTDAGDLYAGGGGCGCQTTGTGSTSLGKLLGALLF